MLEELGLAYRHVPTDFRATSPLNSRSAEFLAINPNGHVPVLDDDGLIVWESMAINLYLVRKFAGPMSPASLDEEARVLMWSFWVVNECERDCVAILLHRAAMPEARRVPASASKAAGRLKQPLRVLEAALLKAPFLAADRFTVADLNVAAVLAWARPEAGLLESFPAVEAWLVAALARPAALRASGPGLRRDIGMLRDLGPGADGDRPSRPPRQ